MEDRGKVNISVVVPLFNEEENIPELYKRLTGVLKGLGRKYEIIFVNDGSTDNTQRVLEDVFRGDNRVRVIELRTNFGKAPALSAGFSNVRGDIVLTIDGDLQDCPEDIPKFIEKMDEGFDIVSAWRMDRKEPFLTRRLPSVIANWCIARLSGVDLHDFGNAYKAYRAEVIKGIKIYGEHHRFIPALAKNFGVTIAEIRVRNEPRRHGQSKYGLSRIPKVFFDMITLKFLLTYSTRPLHVLGPIGSFFGIVGIFLGLRLAYLKIAHGDVLGTKVSLSVCVLCIFLAVQLITLGLLAELLVRIYYESQGKEIYTIRRVLEHKT
ncbi:MAG TPA: glycosyltransferase family 2 protein [Candidatus Avalokitesvara rifleensis]|uniref:glycosyltransferase family 2 protein n=1 Tax=Candidatus Avalokitesvara rifleensis TaxID=3367620 RepID=UPI0027137BCE|nr:glycosyltransferase family 2 protein [Candidatus Brocadiales bacterium]